MVTVYAIIIHTLNLNPNQIHWTDIVKRSAFDYYVIILLLIQLGAKNPKIQLLFRCLFFRKNAICPHLKSTASNLTHLAFKTIPFDIQPLPVPAQPKYSNWMAYFVHVLSYNNTEHYVRYYERIQRVWSLSPVPIGWLAQMPHKIFILIVGLFEFIQWPFNFNSLMLHVHYDKRMPYTCGIIRNRNHIMALCFFGLTKK